MFRDSPESYKGNPFIEAMSKPGAISQIFYKGTSSRMDELFYKGWAEKVRTKLNLSEGLFFALFLADLYAEIQNLKQFKCFDQIMKKLSAIGDDFLPTAFEAEMSEYLMQFFKGHLKEVEFAGCFKTKGKKEIDLRARIRDEWVYFEMTKIMAYEKCPDVMRLYNLLSAFLIGTKMITQKNLELQLSFPSIPDQKTIDAVIGRMSDCLLRREFVVNDTIEGASFCVKQIADYPRLGLQIKADFEMNKLKDKYFEELEHFDNNDINVMIIDTTYLPTEPEILLTSTEKIFDTEGDLSIIAAVIFVSKQYLVTMEDFPLQKMTKSMIKFNKKCTKAKFLRDNLRST
jgi:hypothetical protein